MSRLLVFFGAALLAHAGVAIWGPWFYGVIVGVMLIGAGIAIDDTEWR